MDRSLKYQVISSSFLKMQIIDALSVGGIPRTVANCVFPVSNEYQSKARVFYCETEQRSDDAQGHF